MILESWLSSILNGLRQPKLGSSRRRRDNRSHFAAEVRHLEILEDRALLSAFTVVSSGDAGTGSVTCVFCPPIMRGGLIVARPRQPP